MADQTYRVAIVGAGQHVVYTSDVHSLRDDPSIPVRDTVEAGHAASLALIPNVQVVGICDVDPERTEHFRRTWSGRWLDLRTYSDHQEMLHSEEIDILTVATPEHLHAEVAVNAANAGVKGILCEKPIATSLSDADRIIEACEANGVALTVNHTKGGLPSTTRYGRRSVGGPSVRSPRSSPTCLVTRCSSVTGLM